MSNRFDVKVNTLSSNPQLQRLAALCTAHHVQERALQASIEHQIEERERDCERKRQARQNEAERVRLLGNASIKPISPRRERAVYASEVVERQKRQLLVSLYPNLAPAVNANLRRG